ncbi:immunoglobulin domain-containing protein [bacterium]|nr:immunoglobulin domain-containing protein [bacterium]
MKVLSNKMRKPLLKVMFSLLLTSVGAMAQDGLLVHLKLDETGGELAKDSSGNGHDGTLLGVQAANSQWVDGVTDLNGVPSSNAVSLGVGHVAVTDLPEMTSTTWAAWVRLDKDSSYGTAISAAFDGAGAGHTLGFHTGGNVRKPRVLWNHANGHISIMSEEPVELGEWNHIAVTYDADSEEIVLYVNGEAKADGTVGTTAFSTVNLGRRASSKNCPLNGALDDVSIFDRGLSGDEIGDLFFGEDIDDGLVLSWEFAEEEGFACADSSGNGNDGSLEGYPAVASNWVDGKIGGALSLPQASEHLEITGLPDVTSTTWAAWVRLDAEANYSTAIAATFEGAGAGHTFGFHANDNVRNPRVLWNHKNGHVSLMSPDPVELGEWNHLAVTYDADSEAIVLYVNGEAKADGTVGTTPFSVVHLGQRASTKNYPFNGALDDFKIFSRALGSDEISSLAGSKPNTEPNLDEGLQAHWAFDESEGTEAKDSTNNENHGELFADTDGNFPIWLPEGGKEGGAISFNGANHVEVPDAPSIGAELVGEYTISSWFKSNVALGTGGGGSRMLEKGNSFFFLQWAGGGMNFLVKKGGSNITAVIGDPIDADRWYHIVGVFDGEEIRLYLDGRLKDSTPVGGNIDDAGLPLRIGSDDGSAYFDGAMDDVRMWNRPLTATEIKLLSGVGITGPPVFVQQPKSEARVVGKSITFSVEVDGQIPITYQWFKGADPIAGATGYSLTLDDLTDADAASYTVVATNSEGEATSDAAVLSVNTIKNPELLVHLLLDEKEGLAAADGSGNEFNGTLEDFGSADANWIEGHMDGGLQLDGEYVSVSDLPDVTSTTWAAWVRLDKEANYSTAIAATFEGAGAGHTFGFHANDNVRNPRVLWNHKNGHVSLMSPDPVELGEWNHLAVTYDADTEAIVLYVNGEAKADGTVGTTPFSVLHLGQRASTMNYSFNGGLDHVAIYNRALSSDEIGQLVSKDSVDEGLLVLWNMNETSGLAIADSSGNSHNGVFHSEQSSFWVDGKDGGGLNFTPKSYVSVSGLPEIISTTWSVWVNLQSKPAYGTAIAAGFPGAGAGHSLGFHSGATAFHPRVLWNHALGHTSLMSPDPVKLNEWVHLVVTYDGEAADGEQNLVLYVNGEEKASGAAKTTPFTSINLGQRESSKNAWIDAILDDARIYAKVLQPEEIEELYGRRTAGPPEITSHPQSRTVYSGKDTFFSVAANGREPISFQWFKDGEAIEGEDFEKLELMEITEDDAGVYHAVATNSEGSATSNNATLEVTVLSTETFGLVAQYDFEETSGMVANDSSGNEVHGNLMDFPEGDEHWVEGAFGVGKALRIQKPQYVEVNLPKMMTTVSLTAWVKPESEDNFQTIIGADFEGAVAGHIFGFRAGTTPVHPRVLWNHGGANTSLLHDEPAELGEWVHVALTYDSETKELNFYVNGDVSATASSESTPFRLVNIGRRVPSQNYWLTGVVDNIRIYDVVLPAEDIVAQAKRPPKILEILSLSLAGEEQLDLVLKSPMPGREHVIQRKAHLSDEAWVDQADVSFSEPVGREITATFNSSAGSASFYRAAIVLPKAIYLEDFESGAEGWEHGGTEDNWELGTPVNGPGSAFSGENVYATGLDSDYAPGTGSYLVSPEIDLTGVDVATLVFQEFRDVDQNPVFHNVVVNVLDSDTLEVIEELSRRGGSTSKWKEVSFPLGQDSLNRKVRLEFRLSSDQFDPRQGWYLDDITILPE